MVLKHRCASSLTSRPVVPRQLVKSALLLGAAVLVLGLVGPTAAPSAGTGSPPGAARTTSPSSWQTRASPSIPSPKSCQLLTRVGPQPRQGAVLAAYTVLEALDVAQRGQPLSPPRRNQSGADSDDLAVIDIATVPTVPDHSPTAYVVVSA
jgi:hypothetical protein